MHVNRPIERGMHVNMPIEQAMDQYKLRAGYGPVHAQSRLWS